MTDHCSSFDSEDIWDVPTEAAADSLINAMNYAYAIGEGVHIRDSEELRRIREVWEKHGMPNTRRDLCMALNEVLLHYKGFLEAEKQDKEHRRGPMEVLSSEIQHLSQLLGWSKQGKLCNGCNSHKDFCRCAEVEALLDGTCDKCGRGNKDCHCEASRPLKREPIRECFDAAKKDMEYVHTKRLVKIAERTLKESAERKASCSHITIRFDDPTGDWRCDDCGRRMKQPEYITSD